MFQKILVGRHPKQRYSHNTHAEPALKRTLTGPAEIINRGSELVPEYVIRQEQAAGFLEGPIPGGPPFRALAFGRLAKSNPVDGRGMSRVGPPSTVSAQLTDSRHSAVTPAALRT
jgi:hypothetical protein